MFHFSGGTQIFNLISDLSKAQAKYLLHLITCSEGCYDLIIVSANVVKVSNFQPLYTKKESREVVMGTVAPPVAAPPVTAPPPVSSAPQLSSPLVPITPPTSFPP